MSNNGTCIFKYIYNRIEKEERLKKREVEDEILLKEQRARSLELDKSVTIQKVGFTRSSMSYLLYLYQYMVLFYGSIFPMFVYYVVHPNKIKRSVIFFQEK